MTRALPPAQVLQSIFNDPNAQRLQESIPRLAGAFTQNKRQQRLIDLSRIIGDSSNPQAQLNAINELAVLNPQAAQTISQGTERRQGTLEDLRVAKQEKAKDSLAFAASFGQSIKNAKTFEQKSSIYSGFAAAAEARGIELDPKATPQSYYEGMEEDYINPVIAQAESLGLIGKREPGSPEGKRAFDIEQGFLEAGALDPKQIETDFKRATSLRKEATTVRNQFMQGSRTFVILKSAYDKVLASAKKSNLTGAPRAAADLGLVFNYMKILDPNSSVLPGEAITVQQSGSLPQWIIAKYNSLVKGGKLEPDLRKDLVERAGMIYDTALINQKNLMKEFNKIAKDGNLKNVVIDYINDTTANEEALVIQQETEQPITATQQPTTQQPTTQRIRRYNAQTGKIE